MKNKQHNPNNLLSFSTLFREWTQDKYKDIPEWILKKAAEFGKSVHFIIANYEFIDKNEITPQELLCYESFINEFKDYKVLENEALYENHKLGIMGWIDMIAIKKNNTIPRIIEIKTRSKIEKNIKDYWIEICQLVFYSLIYPHKTRLMLVIINKNNGRVLKHLITKKERQNALKIIGQQLEIYKRKNKIKKFLTFF